jgi:hypothetical protein
LRSDTDEPSPSSLDKKFCLGLFCGRTYRRSHLDDSWEKFAKLVRFLVWLFIGGWQHRFCAYSVNLMVATIPDDWNLLAKHYPPPIRPLGNAYSNLHFHSSGQRVIFTDAGLYFYKIFIARPGHPPFLLPWASVKSIHKRQGLFRNSYIFKIKDDVAKLELELPETIEQELSKLHKHSLIHS